jgi:hypothetical protein
VGGKSNAPASPDYYSLANQQSVEQSQLLQQQTADNRPNTTTPFGSTAWNYSPATGWSGTQTLNPQLQQTLDTSEQGAQQTAQNKLTESGAGSNLLNTDLSNGAFNPVNYGGDQQVQGGNYYNNSAGNAVWNQFQNMEQPLMNQQTESQQSQLEAQGLRPGDEAYDNATKNLQNTQYQQEQSAQDQAVLAGEQEAQTMQGMDVQANQAQMNQQNTQQTQNMNMLNSILGQGGTNPNYGTSSVPGASAGAATAPNLMGAGQNAYDAALNQTNASNAGNANLWSGLGSAAMMAAMVMA